MVTTRQLPAKGTLTIPAELRQKYARNEGDILTPVDLGDGSFFLTPRVAIVSKLVAEMEALREEAGMSVEELLEGLPDQRRKLYQERYASQP